MKKFFLLIVLLLFGFFGGAYLARHSFSAPPEMAVNSFAPAPYPLLHRSIVAIVIGKNNGAFVEKILSSIFSQVYENYRVIYIDDASEDGSYELAQDLIYDSAQLPKVTLVRNEESAGFLPNFFRAIESCEEKEIVFVLQDAEWLAHEWVFQRINQYYANSDLWLGRGECCNYPSLEKESCPLPIFYASLIQNLPRDQPLPALETLAPGHWTQIPEVFVVRHQ